MPGAISLSFVLTHDTDGFEAYFCVRGDRAGIVGGGIDREPMMSPLFEEESSQQPERFGSQTSSLPLSAEEDVDGCVAVVGFEFFVVLDSSRDLSLHVDHQQDLLLRPSELFLDFPEWIGLSPPESDAGFQQDGMEGSGVTPATGPDCKSRAD
jgi:hypothetical protein